MTDQLMTGPWALEQNHPAVLAFLLQMAPDLDTYPMPREEMLETIASLQDLPRDKGYSCSYMDQDDQESWDKVFAELEGLEFTQLGDVGGFSVITYESQSGDVYWFSGDNNVGGADLIVKGAAI